jgi:hypothetical protein
MKLIDKLFKYVKKKWFGQHQLVYHIVREADLLAAYYFDQCLIYKFNKSVFRF